MRPENDLGGTVPSMSSLEIETLWTKKERKVFWTISAELNVMANWYAPSWKHRSLVTDSSDGPHALRSERQRDQHGSTCAHPRSWHHSSSGESHASFVFHHPLF